MFDTRAGSSPDSRPDLLITGGSGFLGRALRRAAGESSVAYTYHAAAPPSPQPNAFALDVRDAEAVLALVHRLRPRAIVHTVYSNDPAVQRAVIVDGSAAVARAAVAVGATLVHVSTDQVFDGEHAPYDEDALPAPVLAYGEAKAEAEGAVRAAHAGAVIARTSLLYSLSPPDPRLQRSLAALDRGEAVTFYTDERRCPAHVDDVARALLELLALAAPPPVAHVAGPEPLARHDFEIACLRALGAPLDRVRLTTIAAGGIRRPRDLTLGARRTPPALLRGLRPLSAWLRELAPR